MMDDIVGIDLGTTNSLIGIMEAGFPILIADSDGRRLTPSIVTFPSEGEPLAGEPARRARVVRPRETISSIKRLMGVRGGGLRETSDPHEVVQRGNQPVRVKVGDEEFSPEEISAHVLRKLKRDAEGALGRAVARAVITVPAYFNDAQRSATKRAAELAGFTVERIVSEPTAAALAYGLDKLSAHSKITVFDLGGGTFDVSILELDEGVFHVLSTSGDTRLGGDDIDRELIAECRSRIPETALSLEQRAVFTDALLAAKHQLSTEREVEINLPFLARERSFSFVLTREELEEVSRPIIERTRQHCLRAMADAKLRPEDLDEVILVGGATRMPLVRQTVSKIFQKEPNISQNPDEAVALGATIQAGILSGAVRDVVLLDVTPLSLGIETFGGVMNVIIPRNSTIPLKAGEMFTSAVSGQRSMLIKVLQGEREMARDNWSLGSFELEFEPAPKGIARVGVQFEIDANGILHVLARDIKTGVEKVVQIRSAVDVSDDAVEAMIGDSLEHAFDDMSERSWTETLLKAKEMLAAVEQALGLVEDELDPVERAEIQRCASAVRDSMASRETKRLKEANAALDRATETLAARIVQKAMDVAGSPAA